MSPSLRMSSITWKCVCMRLSPRAVPGVMCQPSARFVSVSIDMPRYNWGSAYRDGPHSKQIRKFTAQASSHSKHNNPPKIRRLFVTNAASGQSVLSDKIGKLLQLRHIVVPSGQDALLDDIEVRLSRGEDFAQLAKEHSSDTGSASRGGNMGWASRGGGLDPVIEEAAFEADLHENFRAETAKGLHLVQVTAERAEVQQMSVAVLSTLLAEPNSGQHVLQLIDVREDGEFARASLPGFQLLPLSRQEEWAPLVDSQLDPTVDTLVLCHHGVRSNMVANFLTTSKGFERVHNIVGGIDAYSNIDPTVPRY